MEFILFVVADILDFVVDYCRMPCIQFDLLASVYWVQQTVDLTKLNIIQSSNLGGFVVLGNVITFYFFSIFLFDSV